MEKTYDMNADFDYYVSHQSELVGRYDGKYVVIADQRILGVYDNMDEAYNVATKMRKPGEFFLHRIGEGRENYSTILTRVELNA